MAERPGDGADGVRVGDQVGRRLRQLRTGQGLSLSELARRSGVGKGTLSELEGGRRNPTVETLYAVTTALGLPLSSALADLSPTSGRPDPDRPTGLSGSAVTVVLQERFEDAAAVTEVYRMLIRAGAVQESAAHIPGTEERVVVLAGTARLGPVDRPLTVDPGAQGHWLSDGPHLYAAPDGDVDAVLFIRYPRRP
ncbi:helix-turn-helix domain-containing protein [Streptomyces sp. NPDC058045]|uniref:helix-turn-helix domain-containing protein n=1 Tax=Streptomyces sp. NPDC058045 TaxID=3346311 RepID=UPI0036E0E005